MAEDKPEVLAVAVKLPTFWPKDPESWFFQAEAQFRIRNITEEDTKYWHVVSVLDQETACKVRHFLRNPPDKDKYTALKDKLHYVFESSHLERALQILNINSLGDRRPSELLEDMYALLPEGATEDFLFKYKFISLLPEPVRNAVSLETKGSLREIAKVADKVWASSNINTSQVAQVDDGPEIDRVFRQGGAIHSPLCWFHLEYGKKATRCVQPCSYNIWKTKAQKPKNVPAGRP